MALLSKYGKTALIAGASEGLGAAFARHLAQEGLQLILLARRKEKLQAFAKEVEEEYSVQVDTISCDLAKVDALEQIIEQVGEREINVLVYNAAISYIGPFENNSIEQHTQLAQANMITPMQLIQHYGQQMLARGRGAIIQMASLAGFQGSGFLAAYAASKAFDRVLAESLWYEWRDKGVDVIACCAGATATPGYLATQPKKTSFFAPKVQQPEAVVRECFRKLGKKPSHITGRGNRIASFFMGLMPRKMAVKVMGANTEKLVDAEHETRDPG